MTNKKLTATGGPGLQRYLTVVAFSLLVALTLLGSFAFAQRATGTLRGQVLDPQGAAVSSAKVTITNEDTGVTQSLQTTSAGTWNLPSVIPGTYSVAVEATGFKSLVKKNVVVLADQENVADTQLQLGVTSETVEVSGGAVEVQTTSSTLNDNYDSHDVLNLPSAGGVLNGSPLNLAVLSPNVVATPGGTTGIGGSVGGMRPRDNNFTVDGIDDNNLGVTGNTSTVIPDAVSEFAVQTNQFSAEYGHSAGGQYNLVTKTGTNAWHGSGEEYFQNRNLNSVDNLTKQAIQAGTLPGIPAYDNNRLGGTIGGPLVKNKWFLFGAYEYTDLHGQGAPTPLLAPTASGLSLLQSLAVDQSVKDILANYPVAPANDAGFQTVNGQNIPIGNLVIISPQLQHEHDAQVNTDYTRGNHQYAARFLFNHSQFILPTNSTQQQFNQIQTNDSRKISLSDTWSINNNWVSDFRLGYSFFHQNNANPCSACPPDITIVNLGQVTVGPGDNQFNKQNTYQVRDTLSWAHGKHTFKFGGEYLHFIYPQFFLSRSNGDYWYSSLQPLINDQVADVGGRVLRGAGTGSFLGTQSAVYGFIQDDYKVTPRLTLNLGLRYEYWTNPLGSSTQSLNAISNVPGVIDFHNPKTDKNNFGPRIGFAYDPTGSGKTAIRGGFGISYDVKFQNFVSITLPPQLFSELNPGNACTLSPLPSWCTTGNGFLAGGGLPQTFIPPATQADARALTASYIDDTVMPKTLTWSLGVQRELYRNATLEVRYLGTRGLELPIQYRRNFTSYFDAGGTPLPTYLRASDIPATFTASTPTDAQYNSFSCFTNPYANCTLDPNFSNNQYLKYGFFSNVTSDPPKGSSIYHGGSVAFTQRFQHGLSVNANYTYSHAIDNGTNEFFTSLLNPRRAQDTNQLGQDRSNSDLDVRHKFALSWTYELPKAKVENKFLGALLNGYQVGSVFLAQSGQPVTLQSGIDANGNGDTAGDRVVLNPFGSGNTGSDVFPVCAATAGTTSGAAVGTTYLGTAVIANPNATNGCAANPLQSITFDPAIGYTPVNPNARYVVAGPAALATVGRNSIRTPGFGVLNLSIFKNTHFTETAYLQLRAEFFNVLNHPNYTLSNGNVFSTAGITTATTTPGYVLPFDSNFLNSHLFSGGQRTVTLGVKMIF